jgi:hypothetical protein
MIAHRYIDSKTDVSIVLSNSRPPVSDDNAFSEAHFETQNISQTTPARSPTPRTVESGVTSTSTGTTSLAGRGGVYAGTGVHGRYRQVTAEKQHALDERLTQTFERFSAGRPTAPLPALRVVINPISPADPEAGAIDMANFPTLSRVVGA